MVAPAGATIDAASGLVEWTPSPSQPGPWAFEIAVTDDGAPPLGDSQSFIVQVADVSFTPEIISSAPLVANAGELYLYDAEATDADPFDLLTWSLALAPAGASIDPGTGLIEWTPVTAQAGPQEFTIVVGETVLCELAASDENPSDALTFSLPIAPPGAEIDPESGFLSWTPALADSGANAFTVRVTDDGVPPLFAETSFVITVVESGSPLWRINTGGPGHTDSLGRAWSAETGCSSGCTDTSNTTSAIAGAADPTLYRSHRWRAGDFRYSLTVPAGIETTVRLHFANIFAGTSTPGTRIFDVAIEGAPALVDFDIVAAAGHLTARIEQFSVPTSDGTLDLDFLQGAANNPLVSGIEVLAGPPANEPPAIYSAPSAQILLGNTFEYEIGAYDPNGDALAYSFEGEFPAGATIDGDSGAIAWTPEASQVGAANSFVVRATDPAGGFDEQAFGVLVIDPVPGAVVYRVNCGGPAISDLPLAWDANPGSGANSYVNTGNTTTTPGIALIPDATVPSGTPLALYTTERWDPPTLPEMTWSFPLGLAGSYEVRLFFSENFAPAQAPGVRFFDVLVEGALALDDFDPFVEAGGIIGGATMRSTLAAVADGALTIDFLHVAGGNNPSIKAIEVRVAQ
jgi:hypothetical protein